MKRPEKPNGLDAPGLNWRRRKNGWTIYWVARGDVVARGYPLKSARLWPPSADALRASPSLDEWKIIASSCQRLQAEMHEWSNGGASSAIEPRAIYDGTIRAMVRIYQSDPDSPFHNLRPETREHYESLQRTLTKAVGDARIPDLTFRDFKRWHQGFCKPVENGQHRWSRGHGLMTQVRIIIAFGALLKLPGCKDAKETLGAMEFQSPRRREAAMTREWDAMIRAKARELGFGSIALAQALMFGLGLRQKDAIGEWVRNSEPGLSEVTNGRQKWLYGLHWKEADGLIVTHRLSKSLRGRDGILDPAAGTTKTFDLSLYPTVMDELRHIPPEQRIGAFIKEERTGLPWKQKQFARKWRLIAQACGIPDEVQNRDSRAGAATEAERVAGLEKARKALGHKRPDTTRIYTRDEDVATAEVAILRFGKNGSKTS